MTTYIDPLEVRCPVAYCQSEPWRCCCDSRGVNRNTSHRKRHTMAKVQYEASRRKVESLTPNAPSGQVQQ